MMPQFGVNPTDQQAREFSGFSGGVQAPGAGRQIVSEPMPVQQPAQPSPPMNYLSASPTMAPPAMSQWQGGFLPGLQMNAAQGFGGGWADLMRRHGFLEMNQMMNAGSSYLSPQMNGQGGMASVMSGSNPIGNSAY